jgi:hypothetical protein
MGDRVPRNPKAETRDRRFQDKVRSMWNALLKRSRIVRTTGGLNDWDMNVGNTSSTLVAVEVFAKKPTLPPLPVGPVYPAAQQIIMNQVFMPRVSYGQVG